MPIMIINFPAKHTRMATTIPDQTLEQQIASREFHQSWEPALLDCESLNYPSVKFNRWTVYGMGPDEYGRLYGSPYNLPAEKAVSLDGKSNFSLFAGAPEIVLLKENNNILSVPVGTRDVVTILGNEADWMKDDEGRKIVSAIFDARRPDIGVINLFRVGEYIRSSGDLSEMGIRNAFAHDAQWRDAYRQLVNAFARLCGVDQIEQGHMPAIGLNIAHFLVDNGMSWMPSDVQDVIRQIEAQVGAGAAGSAC